MSVKSMTGFGRGEKSNETRTWTFEMRGVNNRYLDVKMKLPKSYACLEEKIRSQIAAHCQRGRVDVFLSVQGDFSDLVDIIVNHGLAKQYYNALLNIASSCSIVENISVKDVANFPEVIVREQKAEDLEESAWPCISEALTEALNEYDAMRLQEGAILAKDLESRLDFFRQTLAEIEKHIPILVQTRHDALKERLNKLLDNDFDPARLAQEVALLADKTDVTEEVVRLHSHIEQFNVFMNEGGSVGRKLDFLIQEFLREVNTMASKINDAKIAHLTVALKSELEKMREQVQNLE